MCQTRNGITCWMVAGLLVGLLGCGDSEGSRMVEPLWRQLRPYLVSPDVVPLCAQTAKGDLNR